MSTVVFVATVFVAALSLNTAVALAQTEHEVHHPESAPPAETPAQQASTTPMMALAQKRMEEMQSHWQEMSETQDPAERRKLIQAHREKMREMTAMLQAQGMMPMVKRMGEMDLNLEKILATDDPQERQRLIREHREAMRQTMGMMRGGPGPMAMMGDSGMSACPGMMPTVQRLEELQADLDKILETEASAKRQELLEAYRDKLSGTIGMMGGGQGGMMGGGQGGMMGGGQGGMMGGGQGGMMGGGQGGMMGGGQGGMMGGQMPDVEQMHQSVERRLELIQRLVEQLLEYHIR
jgi:hypothetical protein